MHLDAGRGGHAFHVVTSAATGRGDRHRLDDGRRAAAVDDALDYHCRDNEDEQGENDGDDDANEKPGAVVVVSGLRRDVVSIVEH